MPLAISDYCNSLKHAYLLVTKGAVRSVPASPSKKIGRFFWSLLEPTSSHLDLPDLSLPHQSPTWVCPRVLPYSPAFYKHDQEASQLVNKCHK